MRALVVQHNERELPGLVGERAEHHGIEVVPLVVTADTTYPDPREFDLIVPLGAPESVRDTDVPWIPRELDMLSRAVDAHVPVLGICFGAQMLAHVLGGVVTPGPEPEIGWREVRSSDPGLVASGWWFELHFDVFTVPPRAREIARNDSGPQAFTDGPHLGVQFHPEITTDILELWLSHWPELFEQLAVDAGELVTETRHREAQVRAATFRLVDRWLAQTT